VRSNHTARERDVGEVFAIGVDLGIGRIGGTPKCEILSGGGRMRGPGRGLAGAPRSFRRSRGGCV
jgi:hypothetical protein